MEKKYTVLKRFGDYKKGEEFDPTADGYEGSDEDIATAVADGFLKEIVADDAAGAGADSAAKPAKAGVPATIATVTYQGGERVFSQEVHGDNFMELAKEFVETNGGTIA